MFRPDGNLAELFFRGSRTSRTSPETDSWNSALTQCQRCSDAWKTTKYTWNMLKCKKILACLAHKAPYNVLTRCPKVASLYMHSRVRNCPEQCQTCSNAWKISTHSWVDINTMWFGGFQTIQIFWTITNTLSTFHLNIYPPPLHTNTNTKEKQKKNMIKIIKNNSNLFKCHSFMQLYFHYHYLFQEAHILWQSHNTNFRFLFFLIQIHSGLSERFFIAFWYTLNNLST